jgi:hypothetical protein
MVCLSSPYTSVTEVHPSSTCGYNTLAHQDTDKNKSGQHTKGEQWTQCTPYDFTGCLAHVDITYDEQSGEVCYIMGFLNHNEACQLSIMKCIPAIPLHPHVIEVTLEQLGDGARHITISTKH